MRCPHALGYVSVGRVGEEELPLCSQSGANVLLPIDVFLATIDHADVACATRRGESAEPKQMSDGVDFICSLRTSTQRQQLVFQDVLGVRAFIHQVQFCYYADGAHT